MTLHCNLFQCLTPNPNLLPLLITANISPKITFFFFFFEKFTYMWCLSPFPIPHPQLAPPSAPSVTQNSHIRIIKSINQEITKSNPK